MKGLRARVPVARNVALPAERNAFASHVADVLRSGSAVVVTRSDSTSEARREKWESEFYDEQVIASGPRAGTTRRVRRYRKTPIERQWEQFFTDLRRDARSDQSDRKQGHLTCAECGKKYSTRAPDDFVHCTPRKDDLTWS